MPKQFVRVSGRDGSQTPSGEAARATLNGLLENIKLENCRYNEAVICTLKPCN
jgi:hypothetical protein